MAWSNLDTILTLISIAGGLYFAVVVIGDSLRALWRSWVPVKDSAGRRPIVMSRSADEDDHEPWSGLGTGREPDQDRTQAAPITRDITPDQLLTLYTLMRRPKPPTRNEARAALAACGVPLHNELWADAAPAAPPEDDATVTPIAGRRTHAVFYPDQPDLEYQPPPRH